jgi:hypothetical protein
MRIPWMMVLFLSGFALAGCSVMPVATTNTDSPQSGAAMQGRVHGGQQPIVGAHVYLYAINTTGYGNASVSLLTSATGNPADGSGNYYVTTGSNGDFTITSDYTCPSTGSQAYLYSIGGNAGSGANSAAGLMAALGTCPISSTLSSSLYAVVNEVSTVATAYAIAGFATDATHVSRSSSALAKTGIVHAFANTSNLETLSTGLALTTTPSGTANVPLTTINTLANILAACINSAGPSSTACTTLFMNAVNTSETTTETASAALNIAHAPGANIANLYGLQTGTAPFQPMLSAQPNDFTIGLYTGQGGLLSEPISVAIDGSGDAWILNNIPFLGPPGGVTEVASSTTILSPSNFTSASWINDSPQGMAIDNSGNVWIALVNGSGVTELNNSGTTYAGTPFTGNGILSPDGVAIDGLGNAWIADGDSNAVSELNGSGVSSGFSPLTGNGMDHTSSVAVDGSGDVWVASSAGFKVSQWSNSGSSLGYCACGGINVPVAVAIDSSGNVWVANNGGNSVTEILGSTNTASSASPITGGGINAPEGIAIDGAGNVWVVNNGSNSVTELSSAGELLSGANGYTGGALDAPTAIAVDGSGDVWISSQGPNAGSSSASELIGAATPVITPIAAGLPSTPTANRTSNLGTRP